MLPKRTISQHSEILNDLHENSCLIDTREIFLHSYISSSDEEPGIDYRMAVNVQKNLRFLESLNCEPILIHLYSEGGDINWANAIYDSIIHCKSHITILGYGAISSAGSFILQSADFRILMPNSWFMIHYGESGTLDHHLGFLTEAEWIKKHMGKWMDIYVSKCKQGIKFNGKTEKYIKQFLNRKICDKMHFYMCPSEAKDYGFIDGILGEKKCIAIENLLKNE